MTDNSHGWMDYTLTNSSDRTKVLLRRRFLDPSQERLMNEQRIKKAVVSERLWDWTVRFHVRRASVLSSGSKKNPPHGVQTVVEATEVDASSETDEMMKPVNL